ncbi:MFS transporter [Pedobacter sp. HMWF019]|uniref:MFS transporter n=1 Tax=Pedobacter sp. HMWF019 TaxID=2056856 RepID=UPI000D37D2FD|nr:MFS transporter [Pedobacter sp. HMWF019]PTS96037.1 MFS transporter [Pedobacter sp. HMWF019]
MKSVFRIKKNTLALAAISLSSLMFGLEISSVPVILSTLEKVLYGDFKDVQWVMNAYTIACTTVLMAAGTLADRYGRKRIFVIGLVLFGLTSLICGLAQGMPVLIVSRFLQGIGAGTMLICQIATLSHQFRAGKERSRAFAVWGVIFGIGLGFGPIIGGMIVAFASWKWVFLVHFPLSAITLLLLFGGVEESRNPYAQRLDIWGTISLSAAVFALIYFITQGPDLGFTSTAAIGILILSVLSFCVFLYVEKISQHPMFDFSVFRIRNFSGAIVASAGMNFAFWPFMIYLPIYFQSGLGYDSILAGVSLLAYTLPTLVFPPLAEKMSVKYRPGVVIPFGLFTIGIGFLLMRYGIRAEQSSWLTMLPGSLVAGIGLGLTNTPTTNTTTGSVSSNRAGMASGIDMSARLITLAINIALMGFILISGIFSHLKNALSASYTEAQLQAMAEKIATGNVSGGVAHAALVHGFDLVTLFSSIGVLVLAVVSYLIFKKE